MVHLDARESVKTHSGRRPVWISIGRDADEVTLH